LVIPRAYGFLSLRNNKKGIHYVQVQTLENTPGWINCFCHYAAAHPAQHDPPVWLSILQLASAAPPPGLPVSCRSPAAVRASRIELTKFWDFWGMAFKRTEWRAVRLMAAERSSERSTATG
jgi:hypothetical protein